MSNKAPIYMFRRNAKLYVKPKMHGPVGDEPVQRVDEETCTDCGYHICACGQLAKGPLCRSYVGPIAEREQLREGWCPSPIKSGGDTIEAYRHEPSGHIVTCFQMWEGAVSSEHTLQYAESRDEAMRAAEDHHYGKQGWVRSPLSS